MFRPCLHRLLLTALLCGSVAAADTAKDDDDDIVPASPITAMIENCKNTKLKHELKALDKAAAVLDKVQDERSAKSACLRIRKFFNNLPPMLSLNMQELELLSKAQNLVNRKMWILLNEPYFETTDLQEVWTLMTDPFSRPVASR